MIRSTVRKYLNNFIRYFGTTNLTEGKKPIYIHTIGIEGCGHHFWWSYLDRLLAHIAKKNKKIFYNNLHKNNLRKEVQDIYFKWNEFDKKTNDEPKEKLFNNLREKVVNECDNVIMWNCDSYPTQIFRKPEQNIDFIEIYNNLNDIMDFKYILNSTPKCNSKTCCRKGGVAVGFVLYSPSKMRSTNEAIQPAHAGTKIRNIFFA